MNTTTSFDPSVSEFEEQADNYDHWFRARVQEALDDPRPGLATRGSHGALESLAGGNEGAAYGPLNDQKEHHEIWCPTRRCFISPHSLPSLGLVAHKVCESTVQIDHLSMMQVDIGRLLHDAVPDRLHEADALRA